MGTGWQGWLYVAAVTYLARDEVKGNSARRVRLFFALLVLWALAWSTFSGMHLALETLWIAGLIVFHFRMLRAPMSALWKNPSSPQATGRMVGTLLRTLPVTDALGMIAVGVYWPWALAALAFMLPGPFLMKRFYST